MRLLLEHVPACATAPANGDISPLCFVASANQADAVRLLLEAAPDAASSRTHSSDTALHWTASAGAAAAAQVLLEAAPALALVTNHGGHTPLSRAAAAGAAAVVSLLLAAAPAAALLTDTEGSTPLMLAVKEKNAAVVEQLVAAAPEAAAMQDKKGNTALHWGAASESPRVFRILWVALGTAGVDSPLGWQITRGLPRQAALAAGQGQERVDSLPSARLVLSSMGRARACKTSETMPALPSRRAACSHCPSAAGSCTRSRQRGQRSRRPGALQPLAPHCPLPSCWWQLSPRLWHQKM